MGNLRSQIYGLVNNLFAAVLFAGMAMVTQILYSRFGPVWAKPVMDGLITFVIVLTLFLCVRAILSMPRAKVAITPENAGGFVLGWLHKFNLEVKTLQDDDCHFMYKVTTDGEKVVTIRRSRKYYSDYLTFRALITLSDSEKKEFAEFTDYERASLVLALQLEIARAVMGYKTDALLKEDLWLFRHVPISPTLSEETIINTIWEMEAMVTTLFSTGALAILNHRKNSPPPTIIEADIEES